MSSSHLTRPAELTEAEAHGRHTAATAEPTEKITTALVECVEVELNVAIVALLPAVVRERYGFAVRRVGGGASLAYREGNLHKTLGLGLTEPVTEKLIADVIDWHREHGSTALRIQIAPDALPSDWDEICAVHGLTGGGWTVKLAGAVDAIQSRTTDLRIAPVTPAQAGQWASLITDVFGMPEPFTMATAASVGQPAYRGYAAWDGDEMVAAASLFIHGEAAALNSDATEESHRGRGAQSALIAARAAAAAAVGCRWLVAETARPEPGDSTPSLNNMIRLGLTPLYDRQDWVWQAATSGRPS
ncbi:GNAT family N-acetyltransferase [Micromonospora sp. NPDC049559]|uniref:GNAT family N-acetyltransferase n=1 Tax=Micromonospora sp. NPDC049559 TaxID=3155923 RepID=UPI00344A24F8